jgi:NADH:ubiquinone oxidoreductase subunit 4 (subunit M)
MRNNFFIFYFSFELIIIPILLIILRGGRQIEKLKRSNFFIFYSIFFSFPFLIILLKINSFLNIISIKFKINRIFLFFITILFLIKIPIYLFHFWLPKVHVEASTPARIILAGLLLKFGTFGINFFLKIINKTFFILFFIISLIGIIFSNIICLIQRDLKSFLAFSRIVHINFLIFNFLIINKLRKFSSFIIIISHGFISTILFYLVGEIYKYNNSRLFYFIKRIFFNNWKFLFICLLFFLFNIGLPINLSFFSELIGFLRIYNFKFTFLIIIFIYFIYRFFYILFIILNLILGKQKIKIKENNNFNLINFIYLSLIYFLII